MNSDKQNIRPDDSLKGVQNARVISVAQFFEANRQMLGFSSPSRNLLITIKEAVDNALDAAEDHNILLDLDIAIQSIDKQVYRVKIVDNGPGIPVAKIGSVFGKLLYGSKFHQKKQKRGQQGLGISACLLNSQIDLNKPVTVVSKTKQDSVAYKQDISMDILKNRAVIFNKKKLTVQYQHGVSIEIYVRGKYISQGIRSIPYYLEQVSFMNPWVKITLREPANTVRVYDRTSESIKLPQVAKIYPLTVPLGVLSRLLRQCTTYTIAEFLENRLKV